MATYKVIGLMSGSSLDGVDLAYCRFEEQNGKWKFDLLKADCIPYPTKWKLRLQKLVLQNAITYIKTHTYYGHFLGNVLLKFIDDQEINKTEVNFIASHGQTIFHQPENHLTSQIGDGAAIAVRTELPVVCNFRTTDVALNGQGAPIAPVGDKHLFPGYRFYLNLGGIANISCITEEKTIAYDICGCNMALNNLAEKTGSDVEYDKDGQLARSGSLNNELLHELNSTWYFEKNYPKTLSGGWVTKVMLGIVRNYDISIEDKLHTVTEHIAGQVAREIEHIYEKEGIQREDGDKILITGGGAFNKYLIERISEHASAGIEIPDETTVMYKEAVITAFMGVLRMRQEANCLKSVTGAESDSVGGAIYHSKPRVSGFPEFEF